MAASDKNIVISPQRGSATLSPSLVFTGDGADPISIYALDGVPGSLSFEGSAGQLFSITNNLTSGSIFSVNDVSGIPSIDVDASGLVQIAPLGGTVAIGQSTVTAGQTVDIKGNLRVDGTLTITSTANIANLNADFLDGVDSSQFLRSDTSDTFSGQLTFTNSSAQFILDNSAQSDPRWAFYSWTSGLNIYPINSASTIYLGRDGQVTSVDLYNFSTLSIAGTQILNSSRQLSNVTFGGNTIWHVGNDGSGSGLDADLLDGIQGASFLRSDADDSFTGNIVTTSTNGIRFGNANQTDTNDGFIAAGRFASGLNIVGTQTTAGTGRQVRIWGSVITDGGAAYWHSSNDGAGSGLDADLLDGLNATSGNTGSTIVSRDGSGNFSAGTITASLSGTASASTIVTGTSGQLVRKDDRIIEPNSITAGRLQFGFTSWANNNSAPYADYLHLRSYTDSSGGSDNLIMFLKSGIGMRIWQQTFNSSTAYASYVDVWTTGNDGSGSGLDADLLDGLDSSQFLRSDQDDTFTRLTGTRISLGYDHGNDNSIGCSNWFRSSGNTGWFNGTHGGGWYMTDSTWIRTYASKSIYQNAGTLRTDGTLQVGGSGSTFNAPNGGTVTINGSTAWHAGNDGTDSGLDADLLDGQQGSYYLNTSGTAQTKSGDLRIGGSTYNIAIGLNGIRASNSVGHSATHNEGIFWHTGNDYSIYRTAGAWSSPNYQQLYFNWPTGIYIDGGTAYGLSGVRIVGNNNSLSVNGNVVWNAGNDGSGSGLDSDLLDGQQGSYYLNTDTTAQSKTGKLWASYGNTNIGGYSWVDAAFTTNSIEIVNNNDTVTTSSPTLAFHRYGSGGPQFRLDASGTNVLYLESAQANSARNPGAQGNTYFSSLSLTSSDANGIYVNSNKVWHAGNDGAGSGLDADSLDGYTWDSSGKNLRGTEIYADNWFRNYNSGEGIYNQATAMHWYSDANNRWRLYSTQASASILFTTNGNTARGYLYADTASSIGFLNTGGQWVLRYLSTDGLSPNLYFREEANETWSGNPGSDEGKIEYHSNRFYIASGSNSAEIARFRQSGTDRVVIQNSGNIQVNGSNVWHAGNDGSGSGLDADTVDGYQGGNLANSTHTATSANNRAVGWYTVATNTGNRAVARFGIRDTASGDHQSCVFYASHHYGNNSEITVLHSGRYSGTPFRYIRIKEGGTYDGALLQVYIDDATNALTFYLLGDNFQDSGWVIKNWVADGTNPGGVSNFAALTNVAAQVDLDQVMDGGIVTTGNVYAGGKTTQYVLTGAGNDGAGSGIDADFLDGLDSGSFVRSDANDSISGNINFTSGSTPIQTNSILFNNTESSGYYTSQQGVLAFDENFYSDTGYGTGTYDPDTVFTGGNGGGLLIRNEDGWGAIFTTQNTRWASAEWANLKIGSNQVWHVGNDGSGSGLDADLLDGQDSSFYRNASNINAGTFPDRFDSGTRYNIGYIDGHSGDNYDKLRVYNSSSYTIGMKSAQTFGWLNDWAMTFTFNNETDRGFLWRDIDDSAAQGAMSLTTNGNLCVANVIAVGGQTTRYLREPSGNYGSIQISGSGYGNWEGFSIDGRAVFMHDGGSATGIYNDVNNHWLFYGVHGSYTRMYHNGSTCIETVSSSSATIGGNTIWHAGNDGTGSGLDADTVDGLQASSFLRSDASDTTTGSLTINGSLNVDTINNRTGQQLILNAGEASGKFSGQTNEYVYVNSESGLMISTPDRAHSNFESGYTQDTTIIRGEYMSVSGNTVWHAGNDGSGSGLDADLLDGKQHTNFGATLATYGTTAGTSGRIRCTAPFNTNSARMFQVTISIYSSYTIHTYVIGGYMYPTTNQWYSPTCIYTGRGSPDVIVGRDNNGRAYISIANGNYTGVRVHNMTLGYQTDITDIYNPWTITIDAGTENSVTPSISRVWHSTNDGSGSGLDADLLDGINSSSFLRSDAADSWSGTLSWGASNTHGLSFQNSSYTGNYLYIGGWTSANSNGISRIRNSNANLHLDSGANGNLYLNHYSGGTVYARGQTVWHAGNDGSGSGLDADTVDGIQGDSFLRSDTADTSSRMISFYTNMSSQEDYVNSPISIRERDNAGAGDGEDRDSPNLNFHWSGRVSKSLWMGANGWMNWGEYNTSGVPTADGTFRAGNLLISTSNHQVWHAGNDGAGSGLDADLLDGLNEDTFMRRSANSDLVMNSQVLHFGASNTNSKIRWSGTTTLWDLISGDLKIRDDLTDRFTFSRTTGNLTVSGDVIATDILPPTDNTGVVGNSSFTWNNGQFTNLTIDGTLNVRAAIDLADNDILRFGSGDDAEFFCNGSHFYLDLNSGIGNFYIRDGTTTRFTFDDAGHFTATGNVTAYSDITLKENIEVIPDAMEKLQTLHGITYTRKDHDKNTKYTGVIAQEVEKVLPEAVQTNEEGIKSVAYGNMVGLLIEAIKEQQKQIDMLKGKLGIE